MLCKDKANKKKGIKKPDNCYKNISLTRKSLNIYYKSTIDWHVYLRFSSIEMMASHRWCLLFVCELNTSIKYASSSQQMLDNNWFPSNVTTSKNSTTQLKRLGLSLYLTQYRFQMYCYIKRSVVVMESNLSCIHILRFCSLTKSK